MELLKASTTGSRSGCVIAPASPREPDVIALLEAGAAYLSELYPPESTFYFDVDQLDIPELTFYAARTPAGAAVGTAGLLRLYRARVELKRLYVDPSVRGSGVASDLLDRLESDAEAEGFAEVVLETGNAQDAAMALYQASGYRRIPNFGPYVGAPMSICMAKTLRPFSR